MYRIRIKLQAFHTYLINKATKDIIEIAQRYGSKIIGPLPLPTRIEKFTFLISPNIDKNAREQYEIRTHKRLIDIFTINNKLLESFKEIEGSFGVKYKINFLKT